MDYSELMPTIDVADGLKRMMNNKKLYAKLMLKFEGRRMADDIIAQIEAGDCEKIAEAAHTLKGVSANLGMPALRGIVLEIETQAKAGEPAAGLIDELNKQVAAAEEVLSRLIVNGEMVS